MKRPVKALPQTHPDDRLALLREKQSFKMARSAHAYVRGSTARFYEWIGDNALSVPAGPPVWICGDCHSGNLGPLGAADGRLALQLRDLDQTVVGNPAWDLMRLLLSLASAARGMDLAGVTTLHMIEAGCRGYAHGLRAPHVELRHPPLLRQMLRTSTRRASTALAHERLDGLLPHLPRGRAFWPLSDTEQLQVQQAFDGPDGAQRLDTLLGGVGSELRNATRPVLLDAAYWVKGCSSLGLMRIAILVAVGKAADALEAGRDTGTSSKMERRFWKAVRQHWRNGDIRLLDLKQAVQSVAPTADPALMPDDPAERVMAGANALAPNLGRRMTTIKLGGRSMFARELMPQDLKLELAGVDDQAAIELAGALAKVVGQAHGAQMSTADRQRWAKTVQASKSKTLDAPSWTWIGVRELMAVHESAYLDHCRRHGQQC